MTQHSDAMKSPQRISTRIFTHRELVLELAINLPLSGIHLDEMRWIVLMTTWCANQSNPDKTKELLFIEDALFNQQKATLH